MAGKPSQTMPDAKSEYHREYYRRVVKPKRDAESAMTKTSSCYYFGLSKKLTLDHKIPRVKGGTDEDSNLVWACSWCNRSKGGLLIEEWRFALAKKLIEWPDLRPNQLDWLSSHGFDAEAIAIESMREIKFSFEGGTTLQRWSARVQHKK